MKKILVIIIALALIGWGAKYAFEHIIRHVDVAKPAGIDQIQGEKTEKKTILRFALVADSENDNVLLQKALEQAQGKGINFVIGLGDWSAVGTNAELLKVKKIFDDSKLQYYLTSGDHDLWDSRDKGHDALTNYKQIFGSPSQEFAKENVEFVIEDNSDIYKGIDAESLIQFAESLKKPAKLRFVFAHKTPFHPTSSHVMGEDSPEVAKQAQEFMSLMEQNKVNGFFSGDLHFFAEFKSPNNTVRITTVGAIDSERNFQGPRYAVVTVYDDYSWQVEDVEIR